MFREKFFKWKSYMQGMNNNSAQETGGTSCELSFVKHGSIGKVFDINSNNCTIKIQTIRIKLK